VNETPPRLSPRCRGGMAVCIARAILHGKGGDVREMLVESIP
jgi:hypothetical protein